MGGNFEDIDDRHKGKGGGGKGRKGKSKPGKGEVSRTKVVAPFLEKIKRDLEAKNSNRAVLQGGGDKGAGQKGYHYLVCIF